MPSRSVLMRSTWVRFEQLVAKGRPGLAEVGEMDAEASAALGEALWPAAG